jgi:solute:Na+ symporter, SSS family
MLGLFLLGIISRQTRNHEAIVATVIGVLVVLWMTFPALIPKEYEILRSTLNINMIIVIGTLTIFLTGVLLTKVKQLPAMAG